jgi:hypothetical protein
VSRTVIVGGYGHVGRRLAARLAGGGSVIVAGRRPDAAHRVATELGVGAAAEPIDLRTGDGLVAVARPGDVVVNAAGDDPDAALLRRSVEHGCHYADLTADRATIAALLALDSKARAAGISALAGIGLAPGATNVLARAAVESLGGADRVDVGLLLSLVDGFGPAAVEWTIDTLSSPDVDAFAQRTVLHFGPLGAHHVYSFGFPEQYFLISSLGVADAHGWFGFRPAAAGRPLAWLAGRSAVRAALRRPRIRAGVLWLSGKLPEPRTGPPVAATAIARRGTAAAQLTLTSRSESDTTATCAAALLGCWDTGTAGAHLPEAVIEPQPFLDALATEGIEVTRPGASR